MAALLEVTSGALSLASAGGIFYYTIGDTRIISTAIEANQSFVRREIGTFSGIYARIPVNTCSGAGTLVFRKNAANGNQSVSIGATTTGEFQDVLHNDTIASGDTVAFGLTPGSGSSLTMTVEVMSALFSANAGTVKRFIQDNSNAATTVTFSLPLAGGTTSGISTQTDTTTSFTIGTTGTLQNLFARVTSNTNSLAVTATSRVNSALGNLTISITASTTGTFEDLTHSDSLVSGSLVNYQIVPGAGTGTVGFRIGCSFYTAGNLNHFIAGGSSAAPVSVVQNANVTTFYPLAGNLIADATEANLQTKAQVPMSISGLQTRIIANTVTAASTLSFRKNAANVNQTVSITASTTGIFQDTTHTDIILATDELNYEVVTGATGTSLSMVYVGVLANSTQFPFALQPVLEPLTIGQLYPTTQMIGY